MLKNCENCQNGVLFSVNAYAFIPMVLFLWLTIAKK